MHFQNLYLLKYQVVFRAFEIWWTSCMTFFWTDFWCSDVALLYWDHPTECLLNYYYILCFTEETKSWEWVNELSLYLKKTPVIHFLCLKSTLSYNWIEYICHFQYRNLFYLDVFHNMVEQICRYFSYITTLGYFGELILLGSTTSHF